MLFYSQIKREFTLSSWKLGQVLYHGHCVTDVRLQNGDAVSAKVQSSGNSPLETTIWMTRGTIRRAQCSCGAEQEEGKHCGHVAAVGIWIVERGSLLRAGVGGTEEGLAEGTNDNVKVEAPKPSAAAECVAFVRGLLENRKLVSLVIEPAFRYLSPESNIVEVTTLNYLRRSFEANTWQSSTGLRVKPDMVQAFGVPVIQSIEAGKASYHGQDALEQLAAILQMEDRSRIVLDRHVDVEIDPRPLKLMSLHIGKRSDNERALSYEFRNAAITIRSEELAKLAAIGHLSNHYVWKGDKIYRFEAPLALLSKYANKSGLSAEEDKDAATFYNGFDSLQDDPDRPLHPLTAYRLMLELGVKDFTVDQDWKEFHDWRKNFEKSRLPVLPAVDYGFTLREYQKNGLSWLWSLFHRGLAALLADDMGLGKTHQALALLSSVYRRRQRPDLPSLVIAPTSVVAAWVQKLRKYDTGLRWHVFHGKSRTLPTKDVDLILTTYGILQRETALREREWHIIMLDEAQAIKNSSTISSRASRVLNSRFRIAMTGTPLENQATDLWSLMEFLIPGYLGSLARFKRLYGTGHDGTTAHQASALKRLFSPFLLRRTKSQVLTELPEKTEEIITCEMTPYQEKRYREYIESDEAEKARASLLSDGKIDYAGILALLTRLKQVCDHPRLPQMTAFGKAKGKKSKATARIKAINPEEGGKWEALSELLRQALGSNLKVVVFTQYLGMMDLVGAWLQQANVGFTELRGDTADRAERLERFANEPECRVFLCSLLAGGLGIDLTSASVCIHLDRWWNPARENQATDRLHRIGQTRGVQVFKLMIPGTVEDRIARIIESKKNLSGALIEESPLGLKAFSRKELLDLLSLPVS